MLGILYTESNHCLIPFDGVIATMTDYGSKLIVALNLTFKYVCASQCLQRIILPKPSLYKTGRPL